MKAEYRPRIFLSVAIISAVYLLVTGPIVIQNLPILLTQIFGVMLIIWAFLSMQLNKQHSKMQKLPEGYFLVMKGPYEILRHPIYAGILIIFSGLVQGAPSFLRYLIFTLLIVMLLAKMVHEEKVLEKEVKEYEVYKKKTHKLIPYLY